MPAKQPTTALDIYLNEQKVTMIDKTAVLEDEFKLTHKVYFEKEQGEQKGKAAFHRTRFSRTISTVSPDAFTKKSPDVLL